MAHHYDDEVIFQYVEGTSEIGQEIEAHAASCGECAGEIGEHREMIEAFRFAEVWEGSPEPVAEVPRPSRLAEAVSLNARLAREETAAEAACDEVLSGPSAWWSTRLRKAGAARTAGLVRQLLGRVRPLIERTPADALQVTTMATEIANDLSVADYPSDFVVTLRAQALRDHAYALSTVGRYPQALGAVDRAEALLRQTPIPDYELARLYLVRSLIYPHLDRVDEAIVSAGQAAEIFVRFGDRKRAAEARIFQGTNLYQSHKIREALEVWQSVERDSSLSDFARVCLVQNIGLCHRDLGQLDAAVQYLSRAAEEFDMLGVETNRAKSRWALATTFLSAGRHQDAIPALRSSWRELESLGLDADGALAALELAEALLITGQPDGVPAICRALLDRFTRNGMTSRAITALAFLRETVAIGQATPAHVRHVHEFLRELPAELPRLFAPSPVGLED
jgi:tetratricopeptide (TPR) repeat protein